MSETPHGAIRAIGEGDRSPEFKAAREQFVTSVNGWLKVIADYRDQGMQLPNGQFVRLVSRIQQTDLGPSRAGRYIAADYEEGVSLTGDGVETPLDLQAVSFMPDGTREVVRVTGSDPLAASVYGDYAFARQQEIIARVSTESLLPGNISQEGEVSVLGDGTVNRRFINPKNGWNTSGPLSTPEEIIQATAMAMASVREIA